MEIDRKINALITEFKIINTKMERQASEFKNIERKFQKEATVFLQKQKRNLEQLERINSELTEYLRIKNEKL